MKVLKNGQKQYLRHEKCVYYSNLCYCALIVMYEYGLLTNFELGSQLNHISNLVDWEMLDVLRDTWLSAKSKIQGLDCSSARWDLCATK